MRFVTITTAGREEFVLHLTGSSTGRRCDELILTLADLRLLRELPPEKLHDWIGYMMTKFVPDRP